MESHLRLYPGQQALTPAQEAEARRFARERIETQLSTEPVEEQEAERLLQQAYAVAQIPPPQHIHWVNGPLELIALLPRLGIIPSICDRLWASVEASLSDTLQASIEAGVSKGVSTGVWASVQTRVWDQVWDQVGDQVWTNLKVRVDARLQASIEASVKAYLSAFQLAVYRFFDVYLAPNALHALAHFNELVSGYWLGAEQAIIVRRPNVLARDQEGRLHQTTGKCVAYHDGWGFYAWHGIPVSAKVILTPEALTREDFVQEPNLEVRRVIQERMGPRFVSVLGGQLIEEGPCGRLYEVPLLNDPEGVARYVQVQDASTARQYFLRVPPTVQTAAEAVAWSFQMAAETYSPAHET